MSKLRKKFILYAFLSVAGLLLVLLGALNIFDFYNVTKTADDTVNVIASSGGSIDEPPPFTPWKDMGEPQGRDRLDSVRYFTYAFDDEGNSTRIAHRMLSISEEDAAKWAKELSHRSRGWSRTYYRYLVYDHENLTYVSVIDQSRELNPAYAVLYGSLIGAFVGLTALFFVLLPVSKYYVKPIEEGNKKQKRFISDASHELKTPLAIISANTEILEISKGESEETKMISKQIKRLNTMVKDLNALARLDEAEKKEISKVDMSFIAEEVWGSFLPTFEAEGKKLVLDIEPDLSLEGNEADLRKCLSIVADNSLKYSKGRAKFSLKKNGGRLILLTENDMENPKEGPCDYVFERFYRSSESRASGIEGSGIGLSIFKEIVDAHHGRAKAFISDGSFILTATL